MPHVEILLATYNGEKFLQDQIESLLGQSYPNISILIRDDASQDGTLAIIDDVCAKYPNQFIWIQDQHGQVGVKENFRLLAEKACAPYTMFCDQDDVWLPAKIEHSLRAMKNLEKKHGLEKPLLVHTDLQVVDANLVPLYPSYQKLRGIPSGKHGLGPLLVQCNVTGCTVMMNHALKSYFLKMPEQVVMHDYWVALCAQVFGHRQCIINEPMILYRQHDANHSASQYPMEGKYRFIWRMFKRQWQGIQTWNVYKHLQRKLRQEFEKNRVQSIFFLNKFEDAIPSQNKKTIQTFMNLPKQRFSQRKKNIAQQSLWPFTFVGRVVFWLLY